MKNTDLISRKAAIDALAKFVPYSICSAEPKKGHWIGIAYDGYADGYPVYNEWECSCCGVIEEDDEPTWNYCPNCGARMDLDEVEE